jgi:hypothetical protein
VVANSSSCRLRIIILGPRIAKLRPVILLAIPPLIRSCAAGPTRGRLQSHHRICPRIYQIRLKDLMRSVIGPRAEPHEPGFGRIAGFLVADHPQSRVGQVLGTVKAPLRGIRLLDGMVVLDEVGIPLVGFAADDPITAIKAILKRPQFAACTRRSIRFGHVVILAQPEGAPGRFLEDLPGW